VEQTDGEPLPQPATIGGDPGDKIASLKAAIASRKSSSDRRPLGRSARALLSTRSGWAWVGLIASQRTTVAESAIRWLQRLVHHHVTSGQALR